MVTGTIESSGCVDAKRLMSARMNLTLALVDVVTGIKIWVALITRSTSTPSTPVCVCANGISAASVRVVFALVHVT